MICGRSSFAERQCACLGKPEGTRWRHLLPSYTHACRVGTNQRVHTGMRGSGCCTGHRTAAPDHCMLKLWTVIAQRGPPSATVIRLRGAPVLLLPARKACAQLTGTWRHLARSGRSAHVQPASRSSGNMTPLKNEALNFPPMRPSSERRQSIDCHDDAVNSLH